MSWTSSGTEVSYVFAPSAASAGDEGRNVEVDLPLATETHVWDSSDRNGLGHVIFTYTLFNLVLHKGGAVL